MAQGLIVGIRGPVKSMKTGTAVWWARMLRARMSLKFGQTLPIFTNMHGTICREQGHPMYGKPWATYVTVNDLLRDLENPMEKAQYRRGVMLWDEIHLYMSSGMMAGAAGELLNGLITQLGKRGMPLIYTTHLRDGVSPKLRYNTEIGVRCRTDNHGQSVLLNIRDETSYYTALAEHDALPDDSWKVLRQAQRLWKWYDTNEPISPYSMAESALATRRYRQIMKKLHDEDPAPQAQAMALEAQNGVVADVIAMPEKRMPRNLLKTGFLPGLPKGE